MKYLCITILAVFSFSLCTASCEKDDTSINAHSNHNNNGNNDSTRNNMKITVGSAVFTAILYDNATVAAFKAMLPLTLNMTELNDNEKYFHLSTNLPANASNPGTIHSGDLMLWGSNSLVLFYKTFSTSYSYTRLGRINNTSGLVAALGNGDVTVRFELQ